MENLKPIGFWGELSGNESYLTPKTPVFENRHGVPLTTSICGSWVAADLFSIEGQEESFWPYPGISALVPDSLEDGWSLWALGPELRRNLEELGEDPSGYLPADREQGSFEGFTTFAATFDEADAISAALASAFARLWKSVILDPSLASEQTSSALESGRKLHRESDLWPRLAYYHLVGDYESFDWELQCLAVRGDGALDRATAIARVEEEITAMRAV